MKTRNLTWQDWLFLFLPIIFFFGCIASTQRGAKTMKKGQVSFGGSYMNCQNLDYPSNDNLELLNGDIRAGVGAGMDLGIMYTYDPSNEDNAYGTLWGDFKAQLTNKNNEVGEPIFSMGLIKGYIHEAEYHVTGVPIMFDLPVSDYFTPGLLYRMEFISSNFIPNSLEDPRHTIALNSEIMLTKPEKSKWVPKLGLSIGYFNSLMGGDGGDGNIMINLGISVDSPY